MQLRQLVHWVNPEFAHSRQGIVQAGTCWTKQLEKHAQSSDVAPLRIASDIRWSSNPSPPGPTRSPNAARPLPSRTTPGRDSRTVARYSSPRAFVATNARGELY